MRIRFSCVAFVPSDAQLGVVGSPSFLGRWDIRRSVPLLPYNVPSQQGIEPSFWFADVEVDEEWLNGTESCGAALDGCSTHSHAEASDGKEIFPDRLLAAMTRANTSTQRRLISGSIRATGCTRDEEFLTLEAAATRRVDHLAPEVAAVLDSHPLRHVKFEYKFILWYSKKPPTPYVPDVPGESSFHAYGSPSCTWNTWLFPPTPAQRAKPPPDGVDVVWEGSGPTSNREFSFDPADVVVDECENGQLEMLYLCKVARFEDPRGGSSEFDHTTRFYSVVKAGGHMHYSRILPNLYVGSCPRQLKHILQLKEDLKVTAIFNLQTVNDIRANFPDPQTSTQSPEALSQLYESAGLCYVWMPTEDMSDPCRKLAVAQCALILDALMQNGHSVYVHCNAGVGRSVAAVGAYLCFSVGLDVRKVNFLISAKRPVAYWDEKAIQSGLLDFQAKFGKGIQLLHDA